MDRSRLKFGGGDRISQLPEPILHRILSHLSPKHALRTCALSKAWRHVAFTLPILELRENRFATDGRGTFFSFLDNTLQRYLDHNLPIQSLVLDILNSDSVSLLDKWIPIILTNMISLNGRFDLSVQGNYYPLPPIILRSESLEELNLRRCRLTPNTVLTLNHLRTLSLTNVHASDETLERIISSFPLIERVTLTRCYVFGTINLIGNNNLKHFSLLGGSDSRPTIKIIHAPSIETLTITGHDNWIHAPNHSSFARLKSLSLSKVRLCENSFVTLSDPDYFGCLEDLTLSYCNGFREFRLTSSSVKNLTLDLSENFDIHVDVPNIVCFELSFFDRQPSIFFTTTSSEWKSEISFNVFSSQVYDTQMLLNIYQLHKAALSRSEFSLHIPDPSELVWRELEDDAVSLYPPAVAIESLSVRLIKHSSSSAAAFLRHLFCFFHPRYIYGNKYEYEYRREYKDRTWYSNKEYCLVGILVHAKIPGLEEVSIESYKENRQQSECRLSSKDSQKIRLRLKWGELSSLQA